MLEGHLRKRQGNCLIDISFQCVAGELLALTGPSGAGKTTIIRMLAGLETPDSGNLLCNGRVWFNSDRRVHLPTRLRKVGYVFQEHTLFPHLSVEENVGFSCRDQGRVRELLELMGISQLGKRKSSKVSGGERQRAAFAQALASDPSVLLLDEPFSALDGLTRLRLRQELKKMKARLRIPVILVTHDQEEAAYLADNVLKIPGTMCVTDCNCTSSELVPANLMCHPAH